MLTSKMKVKQPKTYVGMFVYDVSDSFAELDTGRIFP